MITRYRMIEILGDKQNKVLEQVRGEKGIHLLCFKITLNQLHRSKAKLCCELQITDTTLREENDCSHTSFFKYCDAIWLSDLLTLAWQNSTQIKETLIEVCFAFFTGKNLWVDFVLEYQWFIGHCMMSDSYLVPWKITPEKKNTTFSCKFLEYACLITTTRY